MATRKLFAMPNTGAEPISTDIKRGYSDLAERMKRGVIGQDDSIDQICPFIEIYQAGLSLPGRPAGVILLLGPTGAGKTKSVQELANCIHGSPNLMIRIDCGEFQADHEVAKLIGAPPGYLGHRETVPILTQAKLTGVTSNASMLSIVLFDEIEKASPSMTRLMLGILDYSSLKMGDNTSVNFDNTLIIMTSNIGADQLRKELNPDFGYASIAPVATAANNRLSTIGQNSAKKRLSPEFINRIDLILTYKPLSKDHIDAILDLELDAIVKHVEKAIKWTFAISITKEAREWLVETGFSKDYGARNLKRLLRKDVLHPIALAINRGKISAGDVAKFDVKDDRLELSII